MLDHLPVYRDKIEKLKGPVFVFGASGFIGANLFNDIFKIRKDCYAVTHDATKAWRLKLLNVPFENIIHCDILSDNSIKEVFEKYKPQTIFNLAAYGAYSKQNNVNLRDKCARDGEYPAKLHQGYGLHPRRKQFRVWF